MSRQQRRSLARQDFRTFPFIDLEPLPDIDVTSYVASALKAKNLGSRLANPWPSKPFICRKTGKSYLFWDNYMHHANHLSPLYGPPTELQLKTYKSPYDDRTFHFRQNLKLHNRVKRFEESQELQTVKILNINNQNFSEADLELQVKKKRVTSRFMKKPERTLDEELADLKKKRRSQLMVDVGTADTEVQQKQQTLVSGDCQQKVDENVAWTWKPNGEESVHFGWVTLKWPENYDHLPPIVLPSKKKPPAYYGWTHSDNSDSWYLEASTPSLHKEYMDFYTNVCLEKTMVAKLWDTVFPDTKRPSGYPTRLGFSLSRSM